MVRLSTALLIYYMRKDRRSPRRSFGHRVPRSTPPQATVAELTALFRILDENKDGVITREEFAWMKRVIIKQTSYKIYLDDEAEFNRADYNRDGEISLDEWLRFGKENPPTSASIRSLIQILPPLQCGFTDEVLSAMNRKKMFQFSKRHHLGLDACATNDDLRTALKNLLDSKCAKQCWTEWLTSFWS